MTLDRIDHLAGLKYCGWSMKVFVALPLIIPWSFLFRAQADPSSYVDSDGFQAHQLPSPYQASDTTLRVLLPDRLDSERRYRALYVLPVHEGGVRRHGDGLLEIKKYGYHNEHQLICVAPEFTSKPWFADHDLKPDKQDESHMLKTVIPFVEDHYPVLPELEGRLLIGFSKSGWGALSLLLRNPHLFDKAVGWDIGIRVDTGPFEAWDRDLAIERDFGSFDNFEKYRLSNLIRNRGRLLGDKPRLFYFNRAGQSRGLGGAEVHRLMVDLNMPHRYLYEPFRPHRWDSGWLPEAVRFLVAEK